jgi:hypothetical protein
MPESNGMTESHVISRQRVIDHGEVFTPPGLVNDMLDLVQQECERIDSRFLEPACGNGNFLAEVLRRKLATVHKRTVHKRSARKRSARNSEKWQRDAVLAVCSLYGIDLLADNIAACRARLLAIVTQTYQACHQALLPEAARRAVAFIVSKNIVQGDALTFRTAGGQPIVLCEWSPVNGSLLKRRDYIYEHLLEDSRVASLPLFNDLGENVFIPTRVGEFPPCHYLKVPDVEAEPQ